MNKVTGSYRGFKQFLLEVKVELKKCTWPTRKELMDSTVVVIISLVLLGVYVGLSDAVSMGFLRLVIR
ncbi:MAG: preprotein translocase subunit SecE [Spartobacteria bacterium]|nr:preprotein translocase subunit SecE [Spartobacteria bacterium]